MKLGKPIHIARGVFQIRAIGARVTALVEDEGVILVDTGARGSARMIAAGLQAEGLSLSDIDSVVVSHHHPDHCGALAELVRGRGIGVAAHRLDAGVVSGREPPPRLIRNPLVTKLAQPFIEGMSGAPVTVDTELEDGDILPFCDETQVVHLPGHTAGSIALYLPNRRAVIIGDALQYKFGLRLSPPAAAVTQDPKQAMKSLKKLLEFDFDTICFSHFPPMRRGARDALRRMLERHARRDSAASGA